LARWLSLPWSGTGSAGAPDNLGQDLTVLRGKLLRIDVETGDPATYTIPAQQSIRRESECSPGIWALGVRNRGVRLFDRQDGDYYIADVGQAMREEVDVSRRAAPAAPINGWNIMEGSLCLILILRQHGLTLPVAEYDIREGCSITGGTVYRAAR